jgi:cbb3-type cytochrome oxidase maturation protein
LSILAYLIGVSLVLGSGALALFLWALRSGQYEDLDGAARRILFDGERGDDRSGTSIAPRRKRR